MDPSATAAAGMQQSSIYDMSGGLAFMDPSMQQQHDGRISYDASDTQLMQQMYPHQFNQHSMPSALLGRKHAPDRRPLRFWQPFNDWWRSELTRLGRRPTSEEIGEWYMEAAERTWGETKPTLQETRVHAKCLRSLPLVRDYFRNYRAKKKAKGSDGSGYDGEDTGDGDTEDGTDNGGSSRRQKQTAGAKRARLGGPSTSNPEMAGTSGAQGRGGSGGGNNSDPGAVASAMAGSGVYAGLDLLQAYQPGQYWGDPSQNEEFARQAMLQHMQQVALYQQLAAQQLAGGDLQYALMQQGAEGALDPSLAAAAAAKAAAVPEGGVEPVSGAVGDDEHMDHEPLSGSGATQPHRARHPAQTDTATSNATPHKAAQHGDAADTAALTEEEEAQHVQDKSGSVSRGRTPHENEDVPDFETARVSVAGAASAPARPAVSQHQRQQLLQLASDSGQQELGAHSGSELQQGHGGVDQGAEPMEAEGPGTGLAGQEPARGSAAQPPAAPAAVAVKAEDTGMHLGDAPEHVPQQQQKQQQPSPASKLRQQLDLRDSGAASGDSVAGKGPHQQQQQQPKQQLGATDLQAAMFSAAAAAAVAAAAQTAGPSAAAAHGPTAVSPYVQGLSAAAAAANAGLNLADSPQVRAAVEQEEPHPGAQLPEAAAAALAATPATGGQRAGAAAEHRAGTPGADHVHGISIDVDEAELLNDVEMGGMSHGELVAHIRKVQQELLAKRELLSRSFEQLRRTQDRLARRERKLAKEQQKCKQYQTAVETWQAAWHAAALPTLEPAAQEQDNAPAGPVDAAPAAVATAGTEDKATAPAAEAEKQA